MARDEDPFPYGRTHLMMLKHRVLWIWTEAAAAALAEHEAKIAASHTPGVIASRRNGRPGPGDPDSWRDAYERERKARLAALGLRP